MIQYKIDLNNAHSHYIDVTMQVEQSLKKGQLLWLPDWIPGSYMIRDFSRNIVEIAASSNKRSVGLSKQSKSSWVITEDTSGIELKYRVYAWDLSVRSAHFDDQHCFFNGTSLFLAMRGLEEGVHQVEILESNNISGEWKVATSMPVISVNTKGFGIYSTSSYAELIDHPFEIADYVETQFLVDGIVHRMVFTEAPQGVDLERIALDIQTICQYECSFFGDEQPPFNNFLFMTFVQKNGFGGLEHISSTALHCSHTDLPMIGDPKGDKSEGYQKFLALCSHEYFHCWNVKRIKPARFEAYKLQQEVHSELLWFFEGITSYYDELFLLRAGVISKQNYLDMLAKNITRYVRGKGRLTQTVTESSFDAWTKFYKQDENAPNAIVSYYVKGGLIAFCLDFELRKLTNNTKNLDDLMRLVWQKYGKVSIGVGEKDIQVIAESIVEQSMQEFFDHILYSTEELDLSSLFVKLGINYQLVSESKQMAKGGYRKKPSDATPVCSLDISHKINSAGAEIVHVFEGGCASLVGLSNKDIIIAIDGYRITSGELDRRIAKFPLNTEITLSFFRRDKLYHRPCIIKIGQSNTCYLSFVETNANELFDEWVGSDSPEPRI